MHGFHHVSLYRASDAFVLSNSACQQTFQRKKVNEGDGHNQAGQSTQLIKLVAMVVLPIVYILSSVAIDNFGETV